MSKNYFFAVLPKYFVFITALLVMFGKRTIYFAALGHSALPDWSHKV
jgi:hypothetical protein